jgi:predicted acyltransferase
MGSDNPGKSDRPTVKPSDRIVSVDALRGFDMFWIMGGGPLVMECLRLFSNPLPPWLERHFDHVEWEGFVAWDLIMPLFMFIVGVAMPFSVGKRMARGDSRANIYRKVLWRTLVLFVLGMAAQGNLLAFDLNKLHLYCNTLQAIAAGYLISSIALVELKVRWQAALAGVLLLVYWLLMAFVPVAGHGRPAPLTPDGNLAMLIDKAVLGRFQDGTTYTWILSSLAFGATVLIGVLAGHLLRTRQSGPRKVFLLVVAGIGCLLGGWLWSFAFPIIKHIYSSSMVLWASGWSLLLLALFYGVIDVLSFRRWAFPFTVVGMNAIVAYLAPDFIEFSSISKAFLGGLATHLGTYGNFVLAFGAFGSLWVVLYYLYRNRTFFRI